MTSDPQLRWLRLWTDILEDPKLLILSPDDRWYYCAILALKRTGLLDEDDTRDVLDRKVSLKLRIDHRERDELRNRLVTARLIDENWQPLGWDKRQFSSDSDRTAAERKRRERKRKRHVSVTRDSSVTGIDVSQTCHGRVTTPETEQRQSRTETEKESSLPPLGLDPSAWTRWVDYRIQIRKPLKPTSISAAQRKLAAFGSDQQAVVEQSIAEGYQGLFPLRTPLKKKSEWI